MNASMKFDEMMDITIDYYTEDDFNELKGISDE